MRPPNYHTCNKRDIQYSLKLFPCLVGQFQIWMNDTYIYSYFKTITYNYRYSLFENYPSFVYINDFCYDLVYDKHEQYKNNITKTSVYTTQGMIRNNLNREPTSYGEGQRRGYITVLSVEPLFSSLKSFVSGLVITHCDFAF